MYLQIKISNESLDLYPKTKAKFNYKNPAFGIQKATSLPFTVPKSPKNIRLLGNVDRLDSIQPQDIEDCSLWLGGIPYDYGKIKVKSSSDKSIEIQFVANDLDVFNKLSAYKLHTFIDDFSLGTASFTLYLDFTGTGLVVDLFIETNQFQRVLNVGDTVLMIITDLQNQINAVYPGMASNNGTQLILTGTEPMYISSDRFTVNPSSTYYEKSAETIWTSYFANQTNTNLVFAQLRNDAALSSNKTVNAYDFVNDLHLHINTIFPDRDEPYYNHSIAPFLKLKAIFDKIETELAVNFIGAFINNSTIQNLIFLHNKNIDKMVLAEAGFDAFPLSGNSQEFIFIHKTLIQAIDILPDLSVETFFRAFLDFFCVYPSFNLNNIELKYRSDLLNTTVEDWTGKESKSYELQPSKQDGSRIELINDNDDGNAPTYFHQKGNGDIENKIDVALTRDVLFAYPSYSFTLPNLDKDTKNNIVFTIAKYLGIVNDFPTAESYNINDIVGFWEDWLNFLENAKVANQDFDLTINDLLKLRTFEAPLRRFQTKNGTATVMVSEFSFEASTKFISEVDVEFYTL